MSKRLIQATIFIVFALSFAHIHAQTPAQQDLAIKADYTDISDSELLKQAKSFKSSDPALSSKMAKAALRKSIDNENHRVSAQTHSLLGELALQKENFEQSREHYLKASSIYESLNNMRDQIEASLEYVNTFFVAKQYDEGNKIIDILLPAAQQHGDDLSIALILITKGKGYYKQRRFDDAIAVYKHTLTYLDKPDELIQAHRATLLHEIAQSYKQKNNNDTAISYYKKALEIYSQLDNQKSVARTLNNIAREERNKDNFVVALDYSMRSLEIQKQLDDTKGLAKALTGVGIIYRYLGRYEKSLSHLHEAHQIYKEENSIRDIAETSNQIGLIYTRLKQFDLARSFYQLTIDLPEDKTAPKARAAASREIAVIDWNAKDYESAKAMAHTAHELYQKINNKSKSSFTARILGKIYRDENNYVQAVFYSRKSVSLAAEMGDDNYKLKALGLLGSILINEDLEEAIELLHESLALSIKINDKTEQLNSYHWLRIAEKKRGNTVASLEYAEDEITLINTIQIDKEKKELALAKANLESYKMEMELSALRESAKLDQLELARKNSEIELAVQANRISELELTKNRYASIALASLLAICLLVVMFIYRRFVDSRKQNKELDYLAARDPLTNCYNRRIMFELMNRDFSEVELLDEYCIIMADIDHFKVINDTHGHSAGDTVICGVASILQANCRQNDLVARYGGEEFCIILPSADQDQAMRIAETMRQTIEASEFDSVTVTCSFGVTSIKFDAKTPTELINQADLALYKSKSSNRNTVTLWNKTL